MKLTFILLLLTSIISSVSAQTGHPYEDILPAISNETLIPIRIPEDRSSTIESRTPSRLFKQATRDEILTREKTRVQSGFKRQNSAIPYPSCPNSLPVGQGVLYANLFGYYPSFAPGSYLGNTAISSDASNCANRCTNTPRCTVGLLLDRQCYPYSGPQVNKQYTKFPGTANTVIRNQDCATALAGSNVANIQCCQLYV